MLDEPRPMAPESNALPDYMQPTGPKVFDQGAASRLPEALRSLAKLREQKDCLDFDLKKINESIRRQEQACVVLMDDSGTKNMVLKLTDDLSLQFIRSHHVSVKKDDEAAIIADLDERGMGDIAKRTVNTQTLGKVCRELQDEGVAMLRGVTLTEIPQIRVATA